MIEGKQSQTSGMSREERKLFMKARYSSKSQKPEEDIVFYQELEFREYQLAVKEIELQNLNKEAQDDDDELNTLLDRLSSRRILSSFDEETLRVLRARKRAKAMEKSLSSAYMFRELQDWRDWSENPSYTNFDLPYELKCRERYIKKRDMYEEQFQYEIQQIMAQLTTAYEAARITRHLCITSLWPPLHSRKELARTQHHFFRLKPKQSKRLRWIMNTNII